MSGFIDNLHSTSSSPLGNREFCAYADVNMETLFIDTEPLWRELTGYLWIPNDEKLWYILCCQPEQSVNLPTETLWSSRAVAVMNVVDIIRRDGFDRNTINNCRCVCYDARPYNANTYSMFPQNN